jgi:hypothetical protein
MDVNMIVHKIETIASKEPSGSKRLGQPEINTRNPEHLRLLILVNGQSGLTAETVTVGYSCSMPSYLRIGKIQVQLVAPNYLFL